MTRSKMAPRFLTNSKPMDSNTGILPMLEYAPRRDFWRTFAVLTAVALLVALVAIIAP